jgi:hypothetical protein
MINENIEEMNTSFKLKIIGVVINQTYLSLEEENIFINIEPKRNNTYNLSTLAIENYIVANVNNFNNQNIEAIREIYCLLNNATIYNIRILFDKNIVISLKYGEWILDNKED